MPGPVSIIPARTSSAPSIAARASFASTAASSPCQGGAALGGLLGLGAGQVASLGRALEARCGLLGGLGQGRHRGLGLGPRPLASAACWRSWASSPSVLALAEGGQLGLQLRDPLGRGAGHLRPLVELLKPQLALAQPGAELALGRTRWPRRGRARARPRPGPRPAAGPARGARPRRSRPAPRSRRGAFASRSSRPRLRRAGSRISARRPRPPPAGPRARAARRRPGSRRSSPSSATSFAVRSAASAWRFSGRRRERASRSTSSARSRLSRVRSSFSCARWRRLRCLPRPAASSISMRRSRGFELTIASTRPWLITECISRPMLVSERTSSTSASRQRAPFSRYSPSPLRSIRRVIEISENSLAARPSLVVDHDLDLGEAAAATGPCRRRRSRPASTGRARPAGSARRAPRARRR